ncbi:XdhC family protein [Virgisporangium aurantiacum]|uniref:Cytochrome oxidase I n=1 Tax=Virgisporangium aurantiacum TaxID=175570 RepID=A0A8J3Z623_9ACTN|nr:XdhC/CoxI family protein [Virgisporangium aurantiacum]GIJ57018.1 cytochrome oxidase I [Virgisporangium aurantiacum]
MYEIALSVAACLRAGTRVDVAWVVEATGLGARDLGEALAITPGGGRVGSVLGGSLNDQLADLSSQGITGRVVDLRVGDVDAQLAGLACGGDARCVLVPADMLAGDLWDRLRRREPVGIRVSLDGDRIVGTERVDAAADKTRRVSGSLVEPDTVTSVFWPVPRLLIVGGGPVAEALRAAADLLGWRIDVASDARAATGAIAALAALDKVVVVSHDVELAGAALEAALAGEVGYIGALGSRRTQQTRADWLAHRGVTDLDRVHGPAGLDIGATTPPEIAVSILAEAMKVARATS